MTNPPPSNPEAVPSLDPDTVADDQLLGEAVDSFIGQDAMAKQWLETIVAEQEALRQACEPDVWQLVLGADEHCIARWADLTVALTRWAFEQGRKHSLSIEEPES